MPVEIIVIVAEKRMSNFVAGLTNDDPKTKAPVYKQYSYVQYNGTVSASANITVTFRPSDKKYRFLIIQTSHQDKEALCLAEVQVHLRGTHVFVRHAKILIPMTAYKKHCNVILVNRDIKLHKSLFSYY